MSVLGDTIDYTNFKGAIAATPAQRSKLSSYHHIHGRMVEWQKKQSRILIEMPPC